MANPDNVKVALRIRPLIENEINQGCRSILKQVSGEPQVVLGSGTAKSTDTFTYSHVFSPEVSQREFYYDTVEPLLTKFLDGFNVTVLAYGQTGSGKTFTMGTNFNEEMKYNDSGVIPRVISDLFAKASVIPEAQISYYCSFVELYKETLYDLLSEKENKQERVIDLREDHSCIIMPGLTEVLADTADGALKCLMRGSNNRAVGATAMNAQSSRSHAIFSIKMVRYEPIELASTLHLVDLAGSERSKKTGATGNRLMEGIKINQGLLALGNVISALGTSFNTGFIGYRDSKLTRILQHSLGGNSTTLMIACVSPADYNMDETLSTLRYADRAKQIKNKPVKNVDPHQAEIQHLKAIIHDLRVENLAYRDGNVAEQSQRGDPQVPVDVQTSEPGTEEMAEKIRVLQGKLQSMAHDVAVNRMVEIAAEQAIDGIESQLELPVIPKERILQFINSYRRELASLRPQGQHSLASLPSVSQSKENLNKSENHTQKQMLFHDELMKLDQELALKVELRQKCVGNVTSFTSMVAGNSVAATKTEEYKHTISSLELQIAELNEQLNSTKTLEKTSKLSEERRRKVQQLEQELAEVKKKVLQQAKMLKIKEKGEQKIEKLNGEIQSMKVARVKLLKAMHLDGENFRQWKLNQQKEICQLKAKERKRENEMMRMEMMHTQRQNILRRKVQETAAVNKRLKEALDQQSSIKALRAAKAGAAGNKVGANDGTKQWIDNEINVIKSVKEATVSLDHLMDDRAAQNERLIAMQAVPESSAAEKNQVERNLELCNGNIEGLQQKIVGYDQEAKAKEIADSISKLPQAKLVIGKLFNTVGELAYDVSKGKHEIDDHRATIETLEEMNSQMQKKLKDLQANFSEQLNQNAKEYEEKLAVLLLSAQTKPRVEENDETVNVVWEEASDRLETMRKQLEASEVAKQALQLELESLRNDTGKRGRKPSSKIPNKSTAVVFEDFEDEDEDEDVEYVEQDNDMKRDPDYRGTPLKYRKRASLRQSTLAKTVAPQDGKKVGSKHCMCAGNCGSKRCSCQKAGERCQRGICKCNDTCTNMSSNSLMDAEERKPLPSIVEQLKENSESVHTTPKRIRDANVCETFPFSYKKARPLLDPDM